MSDLYADIFETFEWVEKEAARKARENNPGPIHPKLIDPHSQQANPTNPQSHPPQPQRTPDSAAGAPEPTASPTSCLPTATSCLSNEPAAPPQLVKPGTSLTL